MLTRCRSEVPAVVASDSVAQILKSSTVRDEAIVPFPGASSESTLSQNQ